MPSKWNCPPPTHRAGGLVSRHAIAAAALAAVATSATLPASAAANYWKGGDGADLAAPENWTEGTVPESATGYFNGAYGHGTDYTATISQDASFYQFIWGGSGTAVKSTILDLGGHTMTIKGEANQSFRFEKGSSFEFKNGVLTFSSKPAWVLANDQTLTFGAGLTFNGDAALHGAAAWTGNKIVVRDGAKVNGRLYVGNYQSGGEILVTGEGTEVDFGGGALELSATAASAGNVFRVADGATATNVAATVGRANCTNLAVCVDGGVLGLKSVSVGAAGVSNALSVCNGGVAVSAAGVSLGTGSGSFGLLSVDSGSEFWTEGWDVSGSPNNTTIGKDGVAGGHELFVGDGSSYSTRTFTVAGTGNSISVSNGTVKAVQWGVAGGNTFRVSGANPRVLTTGIHNFRIGDGCTLAFDVPEAGWVEAPFHVQSSTGGFTIPDTAQLAVDARPFRRNGGGTVPLMSFRISQADAFSTALLARWNEELKAKNSSVAYDSQKNALVLTVRKPGFMIAIR